MRKEKTYQAWYGVPESYLKATALTILQEQKSQERLTIIKQIIIGKHITNFFIIIKLMHTVNFNIAAFLTRGKGYYEEYKAEQNFSDYGLPDYIMALIQLQLQILLGSLWLDNYFYGGFFQCNIIKTKHMLPLAEAG